MYAYDLFSKFAFYYEKTVVIMIASVTGAILNIVLNYIFINVFGYTAAGYTTLVCFMIYAIVHYIFMRKVCRECCGGDYPYDSMKIIMITIPFLVSGFLFLMTYNYPFVRYGIVGISIILIIAYRKKIVGIIQDLVGLRSGH